MSTTTSRVSQLLAANADFARTWQTPPTMKQLRTLPGHRVLVLTCMDPRVVPEQFLGPDSRVAVFRNAGGRATPDAVRTFTVFRSLLSDAEGVTVMVVHHTDRGMTHLTNSQIAHDVEVRKSHVKHYHEHTKSSEEEDFGCFAADDLESTILLDVTTLKKEERLTGAEIRGFVLETETGLLREVS